MRPEPGKDIVLVCPGFYSDKYWRDHWLAAGYEMRCYNMEPARRPPFTPGEVVYVPEGFQLIHVSIDPETGYGDDVWHAEKMQPDDCDGYWHLAYRAEDQDAEASVEERGFPWRPAASMPAWAARLHARCVSVEAVQDERWEWVMVFERCEPREEDDDIRS